MILKTKQELLSENLHNFDSLVSIMSHLRSSDGCPWDREQTHLSIRKCLIEETYEVIEAIDSEDKELMCEELGDLIFQAVFHAQIESECNEFDINDVINGICEKMIRRHPHVFGDTYVEDATSVSMNWDEIKKKEYHAKKPSSEFMSAPLHLPSLIKAQKFHSKAKKVIGVGFESREDALYYAKSNPDDIVGTVFALSAVSEFDGIDLEKALNDLINDRISKIVK